MGSSRPWHLANFERGSLLPLCQFKIHARLRSSAKNRERALGLSFAGGHRWSVAQSVAGKRRFMLI